MASIFNIAQHKTSKSGRKDPNAEETLLAMWEGKDSSTKTESVCVRWSNDGHWLAAGGGDGVVRVFDASNGKHNYQNNLGVANAPLGTKINLNEKLPVMAMRFKPTTNGPGHLRVACADGVIELYDLKTKHSRATTNEVDKENNNKPNQTLALDYHPDGTSWMTGGQDKIVRIYDETDPKVPKREMRGTRAGNSGHSNRICAVRFNPDKPTVVASAGLDGTVLLWDTRDRNPEPILSISGVAVAGDAIDFDKTGKFVLTGSWRPMNQLQVYDIRHVGEPISEPIMDIPWRRPEKAPSSASKARWAIVRESVRGSCNVYGAAYVASGNCAGGIVAGGTGTKELKVFMPQEGGVWGGDGMPQPVGVYKVPSGVHGLHVNNTGTLIGVAGVDGSVVAVKMPTPPGPESSDDAETHAYPVAASAGTAP